MSCQTDDFGSRVGTHVGRRTRPVRLGLERERNDRRRPKMAICGVFGVAKQMPRCPMTSDPKRACSTSLGTQGRRTKPTQGQGQRRSYAVGNVDHLGPGPTHNHCSHLCLCRISINRDLISYIFVSISLSTTISGDMINLIYNHLAFAFAFASVPQSIP